MMSRSRVNKFNKLVVAALLFSFIAVTCIAVGVSSAPAYARVSEKNLDLYFFDKEYEITPIKGGEDLVLDTPAATHDGEPQDTYIAPLKPVKLLVGESFTFSYKLKGALAVTGGWPGHAIGGPHNAFDGLMVFNNDGGTGTVGNGHVSGSHISDLKDTDIYTDGAAILVRFTRTADGYAYLLSRQASAADEMTEMISANIPFTDSPELVVPRIYFCGTVKGTLENLSCTLSAHPVSDPDLPTRITTTNIPVSPERSHVEIKDAEKGNYVMNGGGSFLHCTTGIDELGLNNDTLTMSFSMQNNGRIDWLQFYLSNANDGKNNEAVWPNASNLPQANPLFGYNTDGWMPFTDCMYTARDANGAGLGHSPGEDNPNVKDKYDRKKDVVFPTDKSYDFKIVYNGFSISVLRRPTPETKEAAAEFEEVDRLLVKSTYPGAAPAPSNVGMMMVITEASEYTAQGGLQLAINNFKVVHTCAADTSAPVVRTGIVDESYVKDAVYTFEAEAFDNVDETLELVVTFKEQTLTPDADGKYTVNLELGENNVAMEVSDVAGNKYSEVFTVYLDNIAPVITTDIVNGAWLYDVSYTFNASVTDNDPGITYSVKKGNVELTATDGTSYTTSLADGANVFTISGADSVGNTTTQTFIVNCDTSAPELIVAGLTDGAKTNAAGLSFTAAAFDELSQSTTEVVVKLGDTVIEPDGYTYDVTLVSGENTVTVTANDGHDHEIEESYTVYYDATLPTVTLTGAAKVNSAAYTFTVESDGEYTVSFGGAAVTPGADGVCSVTLAEGVNLITVTATSEYGSTVQKNLMVTLSTAAPVVSAGLDDSITVSSDSLTFVVTTSGTAVVKCNDTAVTAGTGGKYTVTLNEGTNSIVVSVTDEFGNSNSKTYTVEYQKAAEGGGCNSSAKGGVAGAAGIVLLALGAALMILTVIRKKKSDKEN